MSASLAYATLRAAVLPSLFDLLVITPSMSYIGIMADELDVLGVFPLAAPGILGIQSLALAGLAAIALASICPSGSR